MKTPSFLELKTLVEYLSEQLTGAQLQEVLTCEEGVVMTFYRFTQHPKTMHLVFDLDRPFPFLGFFSENPWRHLKKSKPCGLFLNAHAKNQHLNKISINEKLGRVVEFHFSNGHQFCLVEFRSIPKNANFIVTANGKSISWYPVDELSEIEISVQNNLEEELRSIPFILNQWLNRRGILGKNKTVAGENSQSPYEKWKLNKTKDLQKKKKALDAIQLQAEKLKSEPWQEVGEFLKQHSLKDLKPEWSIYVDFKKTTSKNMQDCFLKSKAAKNKILGAMKRYEIIQNEIENLKDLSEEAFEKNLRNKTKEKPKRQIEGRYRKMISEDSALVAYMGKNAKENIDLLRKSKAWDLWLHLKDYPSAHTIIHRQKDQSVSDSDLVKFSKWLLKEGLPEKEFQLGGKFNVVVVECRHVRPLKGDKLGRVTYHHAREILIAI